ncbi:hypothetical protein E4H12_01825 [Candidatus Thorarchaeota archaeon]|nr:MAG: hypothetical protein E4H12_01825 [Candidatus Thorarchaeota archaeon]
MIKILNALAITIVVVFASYALGYGKYVDDTIGAVKENASYASEHGVGPWLDRVVCGINQCKEKSK